MVALIRLPRQRSPGSSIFVGSPLASKSSVLLILRVVTSLGYHWKGLPRGCITWRRNTFDGSLRTYLCRQRVRVISRMYHVCVDNSKQKGLEAFYFRNYNLRCRYINKCHERIIPIFETFETDINLMARVM